MKKISLIGSTGSIGKQVIQVVRRHPEEFKIVALVASSNRAEFEKQVGELKPDLYALSSVDKQKALSAADYPQADIIFNAAGGFAGLEYSLRAVSAGKTLACTKNGFGNFTCGQRAFRNLAVLELRQGRKGKAAYNNRKRRGVQGLSRRETENGYPRTGSCASDLEDG